MIDVFWSMLPMLLKGLKYTLLIAALGIVFGLFIGCISGYALWKKHKIFYPISYAYIWLIRGTPLIVQALYIYFVVPKVLHTELSIIHNGEIIVSESVVAGIIAISLNSGAFIAEIVRSALDSVNKGQWLAGEALGLSSLQILFHIVGPIALKNIIPALFNQFIISLKDTSVLAIIVVPEITNQMQNYAVTTYNTIPAYTVGAMFYLAIISVLMVLQKIIEKKLTVSK